MQQERYKQAGRLTPISIAVICLNICFETSFNPQYFPFSVNNLTQLSVVTVGRVGETTIQRTTLRQFKSKLKLTEDSTCLGHLTGT